MFLLGMLLALQSPGEEVIDLEKRDRYYFVDVILSELDPVEPIRFIFDTGANRTAVSGHLAERLGYVESPNPITVAHSLTQPYLTDIFTLVGLDIGTGSRDVDAIVFSEKYCITV